ncbi:MAG: hypothetical protein JNJ61_25640 [Anaerolineae bacterium]|nr:hypothetical protein [Anaerolineae bacterium]
MTLRSRGGQYRRTMPWERESRHRMGKVITLSYIGDSAARQHDRIINALPQDEGRTDCTQPHSIRPGWYTLTVAGEQHVVSITDVYDVEPRREGAVVNGREVFKTMAFRRIVVKFGAIKTVNGNALQVIMSPAQFDSTNPVLRVALVNLSPDRMLAKTAKAA